MEGYVGVLFWFKLGGYGSVGTVCVPVKLYVTQLVFQQCAYLALVLCFKKEGQCTRCCMLFILCRLIQIYAVYQHVILWLKGKHKSQR